MSVIAKNADPFGQQMNQEPSKGFSGYLQAIISTFDFFVRHSIRSIVVSAASIVLSLAILYLNESIGVLQFIVMMISIPVLIISAFQLSLLGSARRILECKNELFESYIRYAQAKGDVSLKKKTILTKAYSFLRFSVFALSCKDLSLEIKDSFIGIAKLFSPLSLGLCFLTFVVMWLQAILVLIMLFSL